MKGKFLKLSLSVFMTLLLFVMSSCEDEVVTTGNIYMSTYQLSSQACHGLKIMEYHSDDSKINFSYDKSLGYVLRLIDTGRKDEQGQKIYYVYADVPEFKENGNSDKVVTQKVDCKFTESKSTGYVAVTYCFYRYKCPWVSESELAKDWRLYKYQINLGDNWFTYNSDRELEFITAQTHTFINDKDPFFTIKYNHGLLIYYNQRDDLPGWPMSKSGTSLATSFDYGLWQTSISTKVEVCYVTDYFLHCIYQQKDSDGNIANIYSYTFVNYTP